MQRHEKEKKVEKRNKMERDKLTTLRAYNIDDKYKDQIREILGFSLVRVQSQVDEKQSQRSNKARETP